MSGTISSDAMLAMLDRYFAPTVLAPFAEDMARRLSRLSNGPLLEIAAGTGVLTQAMSAALSAGLTIIATDPNAKHVDHASVKPGMARITWQTADPEALHFHDASFGIVACHFGVAALPDQVRAFHEARRVMKPGARFVFSVLGHIRQNPVADCVQAALDALFPADPPGFIARSLHGYADNETIDDNLTEAGFTDAIYTAVELPFAAASAHDVALGYCLGTPLRWEIEARIAGDAQNVTQAVTHALQGRFGTGPITATMRAHVISASG